MNDRQYPAGWNKERVEQVLQHYVNQTEEEAVEEDEAAFAAANAAETQRKYLLDFAQTPQGAQFGLAARAIERLPDSDIAVLYEELLELQKQAG